MEEEADREIDELVLKYEKMNNTLLEVKIRKASVINQDYHNQQLLKSQYLNQIHIISQAWKDNPKLCSDAQRRQFLGDIPNIATTLGISDTV
jgi:hypothetical protein